MRDLHAYRSLVASAVAKMVMELLPAVHARVSEERAAATYKWLARECDASADAAKRALADYVKDKGSLNIVKSVHVEALPDDGVAEAAWVASLIEAGRAPTVKAIVGKVDLAAPDAAQKLEALVKTSDLVKGVRYIIDYDGPWGEDNGTHPEVSRHGKDYELSPVFEQEALECISIGKIRDHVDLYVAEQLPFEQILKKVKDQAIAAKLDTDVSQGRAGVAMGECPDRAGQPGRDQFPSGESQGCRVFRLTKREDMTTDYGLEFAKAFFDGAPRHVAICLWVSIPCTGGSPWQNMNKHLSLIHI